MTVLLDLPRLCVNSLCHKLVTQDILRREVELKKKLAFSLLWDKTCFSNLKFGEWKTRNMKMPSPGTTFLKWRLKWWPEGLHCPHYSWQHLLVHKVKTESISDGFNLLLEHKTEMNSPALGCLNGYDPRPVSKENRAIYHIRISLLLLRILHSVYILKKKKSFKR